MSPIKYLVNFAPWAIKVCTGYYWLSSSQVKVTKIIFEFWKKVVWFPRLMVRSCYLFSKDCFIESTVKQKTARDAVETRKKNLVMILVWQETEKNQRQHLSPRILRNWNKKMKNNFEGIPTQTTEKLAAFFKFPIVNPLATISFRRVLWPALVPVAFNFRASTH